MVVKKIRITDDDIIDIKEASPSWLDDKCIKLEHYDNLDALVYEGYFSMEFYVYFRISIPGDPVNTIVTKSVKQDDLDKDVVNWLISDAIDLYAERLKKYILKTL